MDKKNNEIHLLWIVRAVNWINNLIIRHSFLKFLWAIIKHRCTVIFKFFWGGRVHGVVKKYGRGFSIFVFYCIFVLQFFKVFRGGTWGAPFLPPLPLSPCVHPCYKSKWNSDQHLNGGWNKRKFSLQSFRRTWNILRRW